jgi:metallophosphoesterase superfamily enzyme
VRARAFLTDGERCVLPASGPMLGGLNACDRAFAPLFPSGFHGPRDRPQPSVRDRARGALQRLTLTQTPRPAWRRPLRRTG